MGVEEESTGKKIQLTIKFPSNTGRDDITILTKPTTPFSKIYSAVGKALGVAHDSFVLTWDEAKLSGAETPKMHEFSEEEQLDYHVHQTGGGCRS